MSRTILITLVVACLALHATPMPASVTTTKQPIEADKFNKPEEIHDSKERSLTYDKNISNADTYEILEKIKTVNNGLRKPNKQQVALENRPPSGTEYVIDEGTYEKIQQIIASIKPHPFSQQSNKQQDTNTIFNDNDVNQRFAYAKALKLNQNSFNRGMLPSIPMPYITSMPVIVMPQMNNELYNSYSGLNSMQPESYQTRQESSPFQLQWPFASFFPVLVKDPLLGFLHGGGWNNFFEFGQSADVCSRKQKSYNTNDIKQDIFIDHLESDKPIGESYNDDHLQARTRVTRSLKKRNTPTSDQGTDTSKKTKKVIFKPILTRKTTKKPQIVPEKTVVDMINSEVEGDLRNEFTWFGNKKPVAPSPGFFINRLRVRKGGVAIAGPGGVATAGRGGTAIVGPGGFAFTQPGGIAVAGPAARVFALSPHTDLTSLVSRLHQQSEDGSVPRSFNPPSEGKHVATGPVIYYHPNEEETASTQYLPFYGGAKGQYLEIQKDTKGFVVSEKIVAEESISSENVVKNNDDSLLSRLFVANLQSLRTHATNALKLHTLGRKTGSLGHSDKARFKSQLSSLGEAASNTIKLIEEIGDKVDALFNSNVTLLRRYDDNYEDDEISEEGIGVDAPDTDEEGLTDGRIAEAKPIGLAVIGETGLAASRPFGTAVATNGVALARPIGTAIAGIDPTLLGINFQINHFKDAPISYKKRRHQDH